jgi:hypothetical protein
VSDAHLEYAILLLLVILLGTLYANAEAVEPPEPLYEFTGKDNKPS